MKVQKPQIKMSYTLDSFNMIKKVGNQLINYSPHIPIALREPII